jgi:large-conductance mechanosensitive channel
VSQSPYGPANGPIQTPDHPQGPAAYGQGGFGYPPAAPQKTNTMAILGLVFAFLFQPLGIIFSAIGLSQIKKTGEKGRGLALSGLILSIVFMILGVVLFFFVLAAVQEAVETATEETQSAEAATDPDGVLTACQTIIPAIDTFAADMETVTTPEEYGMVVTQTRTALEGATPGVSDPVFVEDVQVLSNDLQLAADSVAAGEDPSYLMDALVEDEARVYDGCVAAGY